MIDENILSLNLERTIDDSYDIEVGIDIFDKIGEYVAKKYSNSKPIIITDSNVRGLYADKLQKEVELHGKECPVLDFPAGEKSKTIDTIIDLTGQMSELKYGRDTVVLALGGGVVGDMVGLAAALFNRGVPYIQVPTTILAQADSSVGGKTAVDTKYGKNLLGIFKQPDKVYIDALTIQTLDDINVRSGLAETVKHGVIQDVNFFMYLEQSIGKLRAKDPQTMLNIAGNNCRIKGTVVEIDPNEKGLRRILNYGHTAGHAIEHLMNNLLPGDKIYPHGYAVSVGMMVASHIARLMKTGLTIEDIVKQGALLECIGLPALIPKEISNEDIIRITALDKKAKDGKARYCLPERLGVMCKFEGQYADFVDNNIVNEALNACR